jgi:hypothetical protein
MDQLTSIKTESNRLIKYLPLSPAMLPNRNADFMRFNDARIMFRDFDKLFQRFCHECQFEEIGKGAGLKMKSNNTIIEPWPMRLKKNATQEEFDILLASSHMGSERYIEWQSLA